MDKLEAVRIAAIHLDQARDEEFHADQAWQRAKVRLLNADRDYAKALDALHEVPRNDAEAPADFAGAG